MNCRQNQANEKILLPRIGKSRWLPQIEQEILVG